MIIQCPQCGNLVSDKAAVCPSCGTPLTTNQVEPDGSHSEESSTSVAPPSSLQTSLPAESWATDIDEPKKGNKGIVAAIIVTAVVFAIGVLFLIRFLNSPGHKLGEVPGLLDKQQYEQVASICDGVLTSFSSLSDQEKRDLAVYYGQLTKKTDNEEYRKKLSSYIRMLYDLKKPYITEYLESNYPDEINHIRLLEAYESYSMGKIGNAKQLCKVLSQTSDNLCFTDKCDLASLLCAIGTVEADNNIKKECANLYDQTCAFNQEEAERRYSKNDEKLKTDIEAVVKDIKTPKEEQPEVSKSAPIRSVIVTGTNVRVRKGPGLNYDPIADIYTGQNIHPDKNQRLEYLGEAGDFYHVRFKGHSCWISKQFSVASTDPVR